MTLLNASGHPITREAEDPQLAELRADVATTSHQLERALEAIASLTAEDRGWAPLDALDTEPSHELLVAEANKVRAFSGMNPLMIRAKHVRGAYVWGGGCTIEARDQGAGEGKHQDVAGVVRAFLEDPGNAAAVFGEQARLELEHDNFDDGQFFVGHWVDPLTGTTSVRTLPFDEITEIYTAPGDKSTPWFYLRTWREHRPGTSTPVELKAWYPDLDYQPATKVKRIKDIPVLWPGKVEPTTGLSGAAVYHFRVNAAGRSRKWGVGDGFAAMPWAKAYSGFLSDCAALYRSLAKIAHVISGTKDKTQLARAAAGAAHGPAGGTVYGNDLQVNTPSFSGINPADGRPFASMVAAATSVAVTILTADPGQEGARAVAETLDKPMRLTIEGRQKLWAQFFRASCGFAIEQAVMAPRGPLRGRIEQVGDRKIAAFLDDTDPTVEVKFPSVEDDDLTVLMDAITKADATGKLPPLEVLRLLLRALKVEGADEILDKYSTDDGEWIDPYAVAADAAGQAAANALRAGGDPADVL